MGDACGGLGLAAFLEPHGGEKGGIAIKIKPEKLNSGSGCIICEYAKTPSIVKDWILCYIDTSQLKQLSQEIKPCWQNKYFYIPFIWAIHLFCKHLWYACYVLALI